MTIVKAILIFWTDSYFALDSFVRSGGKASSGVLVYEINTYVEARTDQSISEGFAAFRLSYIHLSIQVVGSKRSPIEPDVLSIFLSKNVIVI